jgi:hypothetical protein
VSVGGQRYLLRETRQTPHAHPDRLYGPWIRYLMVRVSVVLVCLVTCMSISLTRGFVGEEVGEGRLPPSFG